MIQDLIIYIIYIIYVLVVLLSLGGLLTWVERKQAAIMADRIGANRCYIRIPFTNIKFVAWGLFHGIADGVKMLLKENFKPNTYDKLCYTLAPFFFFIPVMLVFAVIPFGGTLRPAELLSFIPFIKEFFGDTVYKMQVANLDAGILVVLAISGLGVIGTILAGWSSNNKFSLLGAIRGASQMISYEIALGLSIIGVVLIYGTVDLSTIVQKQSGTLFGVFPAWGIFLQPLAAILFITAAIAENKRIPFDLPEAESELVSGFFTEFSAMKMGLFMFGEFIEIAIISAIFATLFLGGFNLPFMTDNGFAFPFGFNYSLPHIVVVVLQLVTFLVKVFVLCSFQILVRWSLPRFRYDQLIKFGWTFLLPLTLVNLILTGVVLFIVG